MGDNKNEGGSKEILHKKVKQEEVVENIAKIYSHRFHYNSKNESQSQEVKICCLNKRASRETFASKSSLLHVFQYPPGHR